MLVHVRVEAPGELTGGGPEAVDTPEAEEPAGVEEPPAGADALRQAELALKMKLKNRN